jgi:formiminotetrahydrofolate cyclodeaminase
MITYSTLALADILDGFASGDPVPGGGSAAALAGAVGTSLLMMVAALPHTRSGTPEEAADLSEASARLRPLRDTLVSLIDRDSEAYGAVMTAYRLPKTTDSEKAARAQAVAAALHEATEVPLDTMRACQQALRGAVVVAQRGNRRASSDVGVAVELLVAGLRGAALNIDANISGLRDTTFIERVKGEREELERNADADAERARREL